MNIYVVEIEDYDFPLVSFQEIIAKDAYYTAKSANKRAKIKHYPIEEYRKAMGI